MTTDATTILTKTAKQLRDALADAYEPAEDFLAERIGNAQAQELLSHIKRCNRSLKDIALDIDALLEKKD